MDINVCLIIVGKLAAGLWRCKINKTILIIAFFDSLAKCVSTRREGTRRLEEVIAAVKEITGSRLKAH